MKRLSKGLYVTVLAGVPALSFAVYLLTGVLGPSVGPAWRAVAGLASLCSAVVVFVMIHRMWTSIQDGHARMTPGQAVGFLFIPLFSVYWIFQVFWGFAKDYNAHVARAGLQIRRLSQGLFLTCIILHLVTILGGLFLVGMATAATGGTYMPASALALFQISSLIYLVVTATSYGFWVAIVVKICDAVNALPLTGGKKDERVDRLVLYCAAGEFAGTSLPLPDEGIVIGRSVARAHLVLSSTSVSATHVHVWPDRDGSGAWVNDMQSTNGTYLLPSIAADWAPLRTPTLLGRHGRFRVSENAAVFEIR